MSAQEFVEQYGYLAVFLGTCLEGQGVLLLAGFFAHRGYLNLPVVLLLAFAGSFIGDQACYVLGRLKGRLLLDRHPAWQPRASWILARVSTHERWLLLAFRFVPGVRMLTPIVLGLAKYPQRRFAVYNLIGGALWSVSIGLLGYFAGHAAGRVFDKVKEHEIKVICGLLAIGLFAWLVRRLWLARRARAADARLLLDARLPPVDQPE